MLSRISRGVISIFHYGISSQYLNDIQLDNLTVLKTLSESKLTKARQSER